MPRLGAAGLILGGACVGLGFRYDHQLDRAARELRAPTDQVIYEKRCRNQIDDAATRFLVVDLAKPVNEARLYWVRRMFGRGWTVLIADQDLDPALEARRFASGPIYTGPIDYVSVDATFFATSPEKVLAAVARDNAAAWQHQGSGRARARLRFDAPGAIAVGACDNSQGKMRYTVAPGHTVVEVELTSL